MNITEFFIKKPVTTIVLNCLIMLLGFLSFQQLTVREYPDIKYPVITVSTSFPNASAEVIEHSVTNILEEKLSGVEGLDVIKSTSNSGNSFIELRLKPNVSIDRSLIAVKDAVYSSKGDLPDQIKEPIIERSAKNQGPPFMAVCMESDTMGFGELTHYANLNIKNLLKSVQGVSEVVVYGRPYTYKVTLDQKKLFTFGINTDELSNAISQSDLSLPAGKFQKKTSTTIISELKSKEEFKNIIVKKGANPVYLKDIAKIEFTEDNRKSRIKINGKPGLCIGIQKTSDENPIDVSNSVRQQVDLLKKQMPEGVKIELSLDQASFIRSSITNIKSSIIEAIILVLVIVFLFLGSFRATLIPIVTVPISLLGSLLFLKAFGFSINVMTLLGMVLAVGLVVDDAIVVLENINRHIEMGKKPMQAALNGAKEIFFAIVAMTLTLVSVYIPIAFVEGKTQQIFTEFAVALAGSVLISGIVAVTLSPLMCAKILKGMKHNKSSKIELIMENLTLRYQRILDLVMECKKLILVFIVMSFVALYYLFAFLPKEIMPSEDRSLIGIFVPANAGEDIDACERNVEKIESAAKDITEASAILSFVQEYGAYVILPLKSKDERKRKADEIVNSMRAKMLSFPSFDAWPWSFSSGLPGLDDSQDNAQLSLIVSSVDSYQTMFNNADKVRKYIEDNKIFKSAYHSLKIDNMSYQINFDDKLLAKLGLSKQQASKMISVFFSGNDNLKFKKDGILYPITIEGNKMPWTLDELYLTNGKNHRISLGTVASLSLKSEAKTLEHYNQMRSFRISTDIVGVDDIKGYMNKLSNAADQVLPNAYKKTWSGLAKATLENSSSALMLILLSLLFIYAVLAVQFESFLDPLIILFTVPLACLGAMMAMYFFGVSLNVYSQVGLVTLIGLISKHGILIVEFANHLVEKENDIVQAVKQAVSTRLRPILMTTCAMVCGSVPLILSSSEGNEARYAMGVVLFAGLSVGTIFTLFILPSIYVFFKKINTR